VDRTTLVLFIVAVAVEGGLVEVQLKGLSGEHVVTVVDWAA